MSSYQTVTSSDRLLMTLVVAGALHAVIIFSISFDIPKPRKVNKSLDIVLVNNINEKVPDKADYLAQQNQLGSGLQEKKAKPAKRVMQQQQEPQQAERQSINDDQRKTKAKKVLTQDRSVKQVATQKTRRENAQEKRKLTAENLSKQIAQLGAEITEAYNEYSKRPKMMYINSVNAHKYKAASYEQAWQEKVERIGNLNYPEEARRKNLSGGLLLSVAINKDGTINYIKIHRSSGHKALDDAAVRIVRLAAPYSKFPKELKQEADVLVITRTWKFFNNNRVSTS